MALFLIEKGADVNAADDNGNTALLGAAGECAMTDVLRVMLAKGARADVKTAGGATAVELAEALGCSENAELLKAAVAGK
jgi:ankyrin repeat protein